MSDKLLTRVTRLISGLAYHAVSNAESAAAIPVMEQAIRDIDEAIKDVRAEIGQNEATKFNATRRVTELQSEHETLNEKIAVALDESRDELAEAGVGRQLDIENQVALLQRTVTDAEQDIAKLSDSINALQASRREAQHRIRDLKATVPASESSGAAAPRGSAASKADAAIEAAERLGEDLTGLPSDSGKISHKDLDELAELHRQNAIRERLAKHRASLKSE
ncbi:MAG: PspA/IM30 family protein [Methyloligellaceae bacterium]